MWQLVRTVAVPYLLFECALALFRIYVGGEQLEDLFRDPHWPMWYLSALFFWRLLTPVFTRMPPRWRSRSPSRLSLVAGLYAGDTLDMARVLGLLPFFVLGLTRHAGAARAAPCQPGAAAPRWSSSSRSRCVATWTDRLAQHRVALLPLAVRRARRRRRAGDAHPAVLLAIGTARRLAFLALVPRVSGWFTRMGAARWSSTCSTGSSSRAPSTPATGLGRADHVRLAGVTHARRRRRSPCCWPGRRWPRVLTHVVDPFGYAERHIDRRGATGRRAGARRPDRRGLEEATGGRSAVPARMPRDGAASDGDERGPVRPPRRRRGAGPAGRRLGRRRRRRGRAGQREGGRRGRRRHRGHAAVRPRRRRRARAADHQKIARGSLRNKLLFILPAALLLSQFLPWLLTPILMVGGTYLCYEGAEKVWERLRGHDDHDASSPCERSGRTPRRRWSPARSAPTSSSPPRSW